MYILMLSLLLLMSVIHLGKKVQSSVIMLNLHETTLCCFEKNSFKVY